ncbi:MAG: ABC transporter permease, partial [Alphaproteobacteria bacterium]
MTSAGEAAAQRRRDKGTRRTVILADRTADWTIRIGGLAVILAVAGILVFLVQVVVPLFTGGHVSGKIEHKLALGDKLPLAATFDEYRTIVAVLAQDGTIKTFHLGTGKVLTDSKLDFAGKQVTAFDRTLRWDDLALGFADGTVRFGRLQLRTEILKPDQLPAGLEKLNEQDRTDGRAIYSAVPGNQFRKISVAASLEDEQKIAPDGTAITAINFHLAGTSERPIKTFVTVDAAGAIRLSRTESRANMLTKKVTTTVSTATMPALPEGAAIDHVLTTESADQVYISDKAGRIFRFDTREFDKPELAETVPAIGNAKLNVMQFLIGQQSLVVGRADGSVNIFFRLQRKDAPTKDGYVLVRAHELEKHAAPVVAFTPS